MNEDGQAKDLRTANDMIAQARTIIETLVYALMETAPAEMTVAEFKCQTVIREAGTWLGICDLLGK